MLAPIAHQLAAPTLQKSPDQRGLQSTDRKLLPIASGNTFKTPATTGTSVETGNPLFQHQTTLIIQTALSSSKIFAITFSYLQRLCYTKVLKVVYKTGECIYKVVLRSEVTASTNVCWLQLRPDGWSLLLGNGLDQRLLTAITSAILTQE